MPEGTSCAGHALPLSRPPCTASRRDTLTSPLSVLPEQRRPPTPNSKAAVKQLQQKECAGPSTGWAHLHQRPEPRLTDALQETGPGGHSQYTCMWGSRHKMNTTKKDMFASYVNASAHVWGKLPLRWNVDLISS